MKDSLNHALVITTLLERDIARISASGTGAQQIIAAKCAELRTAMANHLRYIETLGRIIPPTPEQSAELRKLAEHSFKAGDFNSDHAPEGYFAGHPIGDINEPDDDTYLKHAAVSDAKALADYQRRLSRLGWAMAAIACVSAGVILAGIKIWFTYFNL